MILTLVVTLTGFVGAPARFLLDGWLQRRAETTVPVGTLAVNLTGAFALGFVAGLFAAHHVSHNLETIIGTGLLGAFTTFSTFTFESMRLTEEGAWRALSIYLTTTLVGGLLAAALGLWLASLI